jgi:hypothetical protein
MHIDKFKKEDGFYYDTTGACYGSTEENPRRRAIEFIQCGVLGFCACGDPEDNLMFIRDILMLVDERPEERVEAETMDVSDDKNWAKWYEGWNSRFIELCGNDQSQYFIFYVLDELEFTEHGTGIGGSWLTTKGRELLEDLNFLFPRENDRKRANRYDLAKEKV